MKIGIVTQPLSRNYGGILQNYALQQTLIKLGHTPYTYDLKWPYSWKICIVNNLKSIVKCVIGRPYKFHETPYKRNKREKILRDFVKKHINLISPRDYRPNPNKIKEYGLERLIVGSDQVWRPIYNPHIEDMYLSFSDDTDIKKIAYAASFGTDEWEYTEEKTNRCRVLAQKLDAISVREESGLALCKKYLGVEASYLIDPTLLLSANDYHTLIQHIERPTSPYLFAYILDQSKEKIEYIKNYAKANNLDLIIKGSDSQLSVDDSIEKWIANFRDANYIITDSFHGTVFSIIFNKPFVAVGNETRGMSRFNSLLSRFGLEEYLIDISKEHKIPTSNIDWTKINLNIEACRITAISFLTNNL